LLNSEQSKPKGKTVKLTKSELATLKSRFTKAVKSFKTGKERIADVGLEARKAGVSRSELVAWAKTVVSESWAQVCVSQFWAVKGKSARKGKAGRQAGPEAKALFAYAVKKYGKKAEAVLLAAYRLAKKS
jgi:hypothetical protein